MSKRANYSAGYELKVSRGVRLKFVALQMPVMINFLRKFATKFALIQLEYKFYRWKDKYMAWKAGHLEEMQRKTAAAIPVQAVIRGFNSRNRVKRVRSAQVVTVEEKRKWSMYQIQCFVKLWSKKFRARQRAATRQHLRQNMAATIIQKMFRGFLAKGYTVEVERKKLLHQLRKWSRGISNTLVNMKELQNGYSQLVLFHAIGITAHPSKPIRDLPRLQYVRTVRRALFLLYWRLQTHYTATLNDYKARQRERRAMYLQDLFSQLVEIVAIGDRKRLEAQQREYEASLVREAEERARRQTLSEHMLLTDYRTRAELEARREAERAIQRAYKQKLERLAVQQQALDAIGKEMELMRVEEIVTRNYVTDMKEAAEKRQLIEQQSVLVERARLAGIVLYGEQAALSKTVLGTQLQKLVPRIAPRKNRFLPPPPTAGELGMVKYREQKQQQFLHSVEQFYRYLHSLPLGAAYVQQICEVLAASMEEIVFPAVAPGAEDHAAVSTADGGKKIAAALKAATLKLPSTAELWRRQQAHLQLKQASEAAPVLSDAPELETSFLAAQLLHHADLSAVLQPVRTIAHLHAIELSVPVGIKGMLSRPQLIQLLGEEGQYTSIAQQQYHMRLQCALAVDDTSVSKMRLLLELRRQRRVRAEGYQQLVTEHAAFKQALTALHAKRKEIHSTKYLTRQARKHALQEAAVLEQRVLQLRHSVVNLCASFYGSFHDEVELFLCLFYPVEVKGEDSPTIEDDKQDKIVSKKSLFDSSRPDAVAYHSLSDVELAQRAAEHLQRSLETAAPSPVASPKLGRRSSRIDAVYIAPKKKEQSAATAAAATGGSSAKLYRSKRESVVYTGSTAKKAHIADPYHALHQLPIDKTLQHKLATVRKPVDRLLMYQDYWATIHLDMQYYHVSPVDVASLPAAPIPTFHNDGTPHILKYSQTGASKRINAAHVHKHFDAQPLNVVEKVKLKEGQLKQQKIMKKEVKLHDIPGFNLFQDADDQEYDFSLWAEKVMLWCKDLNGWFRQREASWRQHHRAQALTYLLRLQYLVDGGQGHDGSHAQYKNKNHQYHGEEEPGGENGQIDERALKASSMLMRRKLLAKMHQQQLQEQQRRKRVSKMGMHPSQGYEEHERTLRRRQDELRQEQNSLFLLQQLDQADVLDIYEVLLCRSNIGMKVAGAEQKAVFNKGSAPTTSTPGSAVPDINRDVVPPPPSTPGTPGTPGTPTTAAISVRDLHSSHSRLVTADELDVTVAKHPASLTARFLLIQLAIAQDVELHKKDGTSASLTVSEGLAWSCQNSLLFGANISQTDLNSRTDPQPATNISSVLDHKQSVPTEHSRNTTDVILGTDGSSALQRGIFRDQHPSLLALQALRRELCEVRDIVTQLFADQCISVELAPPTSVAPSGRSAKPMSLSGKGPFIPITTEDFQVTLHYSKIRPVKFVHCEKTHDVWRYHYPSWMQPIVYFGCTAPAETFYRRLQSERRAGGDGLYTRINDRDNRADAAGRCLLRFLKQAVVLRRFVRRQAAEAYTHSVDLLFMQWEDTLAAAIRADEEARRVEEERQKQQRQGCWAKLLSCFQRGVAFRKSARVVHSIASADDEFRDIEAASPALLSAGNSASSGRGTPFSWGFRPKYAKITVFSTEDELRAALKASLEVDLPVQAYPVIAQRPLEKRVMGEMRAIGQLKGLIEVGAGEGGTPMISEKVGGDPGAISGMSEAGRQLQGLLEKYAFLESTATVKDAIIASLTAQGSITPETHYRGASWVTGQAVHLNARGEHVETVRFTSEALQGAAAFYRHIGAVVGQVCVSNDTTAVGAARKTGVRFAAPDHSTSKGVGNTEQSPTQDANRGHNLPGASSKADPTADKLRIQPEELSSVVTAVQPVQEVYFGGGLRNLVAVLRVVDCPALNPRGVAFTHSLLLPRLEPPLPSVAQFEVMLSEAESVRLMKKQLAAQQQRDAAAAAARVKHGRSRRGSKDNTAELQRLKLRSEEASKTIANFIRKRSTAAGRARTKSSDFIATAEGSGEAGSQTVDDSEAAEPALQRSDLGSGPSTSAGAAKAGKAGKVVSAQAPELPVKAQGSASDQHRPLTGGAKASAAARRGSTDRINSVGLTKRPPSSASSAAAARKTTGSRDKLTALETIAKFLRSKAFNATVSRRSRKYNYNGSKLRTEIHLPKALRSEAAGQKIAQFIRSRSGKFNAASAKVEPAPTVSAKEKAAETEAALALQLEQQRDSRAVYCATMFDLFTSARAGFADRKLCQDRLWRFATVVTHKRRSLCDLSVQALQSHERVVKKLPTLRDLQSVLLVALFRDSYLRLEGSTPTLKASTNSTAVPTGGMVPNSRAAPRPADNLHPAAAERRRKCIVVIQCLCRIFLAKKAVALKRAQREQRRQQQQQLWL